MSHPTMAQEANITISGAVIMKRDSCLLHHLRGRATSGLGVGFRIQIRLRGKGKGFRIQDSGQRIRGKGYGAKDTGFRAKDSAACHRGVTSNAKPLVTGV